MLLETSFILTQKVCFAALSKGSIVQKHCKCLLIYTSTYLAEHIEERQFKSLDTHIAGSIGISRIGNQTRFFSTPDFVANEYDNIIPRYAINNAGFSFIGFRKLATSTDPFSMGLFFGATPFTIPMAMPNFSCTACGTMPLARMMSSDSTPTLTEAEEMAYTLTTALTETEYSEDELGVKKISEENLYDVLKNDTSLRTVDSFLMMYEALKIEQTGIAASITDLIHEGDKSTANTALALLAYSNDAEQATKQVLTIINNMNQEVHSVMDEEVLATLESIAASCPYRFGQAVYSARVLINSQYGHENEYWNDELLCIYGVSYRKAQGANDTSKHSDFIRLFPNPATDAIYYEINKVKNDTEPMPFLILIRDMQGRLMQTKSIDSDRKNGSIDIAKLAIGQYIVSVYHAQELVYLQAITKAN